MSVQAVAQESQQGKASTDPYRILIVAEVENPVHTVYFDRSRKSNGTFAKIDTNEKNSAAEIIKNFERCNEHDQSIQQFFRDLLHYIEKTKDGKSMYIISKQHASQKQKHDEKTRSKTDNGERPLRKKTLYPYPALILCIVQSRLRYYNGERAGQHQNQSLPQRFLPIPAARNSIMQLPKTSEEAKHEFECGNTRSSHVVGEVARYDWRNNDQEIIDVVSSQEYRCAEKLKPLFKALQEAQEDGNGDSDDD
eukprot:scaffold23183_cov81-Skeletonema_dohrnii-CCMP3373.AAC.1